MTKAAKPKPKRTAAEKAPVRKASPAKSSTASKSSRPAAKQSKRPAAKTAPAKKAGVKASAPAKSTKSAKKPAAKQQPAKSAAKTAPAKSSKAQASKSAAAPQRPAPRHTPTPPRQPSRDEAAALKAFERAHKEFARGNFSTARELFRTLIDQHGGVSEVTARARTYLTIAEARLQREAALPRDPDSLYDRGVIELNRGDFVAAQEFFERALKRDPDAADTHYALAATRARLGATEAALQALERALELKHVLRVRAQSDADLAPLRNDPEFERIVFSNTRP
ncbi:MAG TPA: tetratricopeptide repeat protein [Pyrinomonadaceae bacterium]|nr:tetratricopeptide repeat protein [Pyrinomonadaceae bacterium]